MQHAIMSSPAHEARSDDHLSVAVVNPTGQQPPGLSAYAPRSFANPANLTGHVDVAVLFGPRPGTMVRELTALRPDRSTPTCALAPQVDIPDIRVAFENGVTSYLILAEWHTSLAMAINCTARKVTVLTPSVTEVLRSSGRTGGCVSSTAADRIRSLSPRQRDVMEMLSRGLSTAEIADALSLAKKTVRNYLAAIFIMLNVRSRSQAILLWLGHESS